VVDAGLSSVEEGRLRELASEAPTVNLLNTLIARALKQGASDMHVEPQGTRARVRFRIGRRAARGRLDRAGHGAAVITRLKILAGMDIASGAGRRTARSICASRARTSTSASRRCRVTTARAR